MFDRQRIVWPIRWYQIYSMFLHFSNYTHAMYAFFPPHHLRIPRIYIELCACMWTRAVLSYFFYIIPLSFLWCNFIWYEIYIQYIYYPKNWQSQTPDLSKRPKTLISSKLLWIKFSSTTLVYSLPICHSGRLDGKDLTKLSMEEI